MCLPSHVWAPLGLIKVFPRASWSGILSGHSWCSGGLPRVSGAALSAPGLLPASLGEYVVYVPGISITITFVLSQLPEAIQYPAKVFTVLLFSCPPPHLTQSQKQLDYCYPSIDHGMYTSHNVPLSPMNAWMTKECWPDVPCLGRKNWGHLLLLPQSTPTSRQQFETSWVWRTQLQASFKF